MARLPLQNRVDPWGQLNAVPSRGALMGNRGILHDETQKIVRAWAHKAWVTCVLSYKGIKRTPFSQGNYSELFFLDEATSLAAGHRPCNTCQPDKFTTFKDTWLRTNIPNYGGSFVAIADIDKTLHSERAMRGGEKQTFDAALSELPIGAIFEYEGEAFLVWTQGLLRWSFEGYAPADLIPPITIVRVLTPKSIVNMFRAGYRPDVHNSVSAYVSL